MSPTRLADVVATSTTVSATRSRSAKRDALAGLLAGLDPDEVPVAVGVLTGELRQGRIGIGWAAVSGVDVAAAGEATLTLGDVDRSAAALAAATGPGSQAVRRELLTDLFGAATEAEQGLLARLLTGGLRQGALEGVMVDAVAAAAGVPLAAVRRAHMLGGDLGRVATVALTDGAEGLARIGLSVGRAVHPMLASTAPDVAAAVGDLGRCSVEWKLDGVRIQVHRRDDDVAIFTRNLNDVTDRLPGVATAALALPVDRLVLDGETLALAEGERPERFQDTSSRFGRDDPTDGAAMRAFWFDVLHVDGRDVVDEPLEERLRLLSGVVGDGRVPGRLTDDPAEAEAVLAEALAAGHEGVMVKAADSTYEAGRRGRAWRKVKPVHTLDLVVLGAEWGHGRRTGWLSNLHLGARDPAGGPPVMVGKTFKGLTDELLTWQTEALLAREEGRSGITVHVRPELVVEVAVDGVQASTRYPGGVALRFARVKGYRPDKDPATADTVDAVRALLG